MARYEQPLLRASLALAVTLASSMVPAVPRRPLRAAHAVAAPVVPVQIAGVRPGAHRTFAAVSHAIHRDALPWLAQCQPPRPARGVVHVELASDARGHWRVTDVTTPRRDASLEQCVRAAAERVVVPPSDVLEEGVTPAPEAEDPVAFDVAFGMPRLGR